MIKTDLPVRAHSEGEESYKSFTRDKRTRIANGGAVYSSRQSNNEEGEKRHSYNPNFTRDNQLRDHNRRNSFGHSDNRSYNREERGERSFNREGGYQRTERNFNREERPYNRERSFNRENREERSFNREGGYQRTERNFNREERPYNRERSFNRENREERSFNREGGHQRTERSFNREERGERTFNRERNFERKPGKFGAPKGRSERKPREPKQFVNTANEYTLENYPSYDTPQQEGAIRLNRYISMSGICSRREADEYITSGTITVNGAVVTELGSKVMPGDVVCYNGKQIENEKKVYIVMNKPKGFVTTLDDPHADKSVMDLVKNACNERIYPVGRLDKNSVGVLLLTNDGDLAKRLTHPTYEKKKIYQVSLDKRLTRADMEQMILGITLEDGDIAADDICYVDDPKMKNAVGIEIHSGRNRIVRRMFEHMGYHVGKLDRVYFAGLTKQKLKRGEWRFLTEKEVAMLKSGSYE